MQLAVVARQLTNEETAAKMSDAELLEFLFLPGFSTRDEADRLASPLPSLSWRGLYWSGYRANLRLGGDTKGMLPDNGTTEVVFRRGTTSMSLTPTCALGNDGSPVLVTAQPSTPDRTATYCLPPCS